MKVICTKDEQLLLKRAIKRDECNPLVCDYTAKCIKPKDWTCGQYIISLIEWVITDEKE